MVVSIPELRRNREKKINSSAEGKSVVLQHRAKISERYKKSFLDKWVPVAFKWKKKEEKKGEEKSFLLLLLL